MTAAERRLAQASDAIVEGVERELPGWVQRQVAFILDAWGRLEVSKRAAAERAAHEAGGEATERVVDGLRELFASIRRGIAATPLEIVRSAYREPTAVLEAAAIPPVERDAFDERAWPDDRYGLVPHTLGDLGRPRPRAAHAGVGNGEGHRACVRTRRARAVRDSNELRSTHTGLHLTYAPPLTNLTGHLSARMRG